MGFFSKKNIECLEYEGPIKNRSLRGGCNPSGKQTCAQLRIKMQGCNDNREGQQAGVSTAPRYKIVILGVFLEELNVYIQVFGCVKRAFSKIYHLANF